MNRRHKVFKVSKELLVDLFSKWLPKDAKIVGVSDQLYFTQDLVAFKVESDTFEEVQEGQSIPQL